MKPAQNISQQGSGKQRSPHGLLTVKKGTRCPAEVNLQQTGRELMMPDEITKMDNGKCIVMVRGLDPFLDDKYDLTQHPNYPECGDASPENQMDITKQEGLYNFAGQHLCGS